MTVLKLFFAWMFYLLFLHTTEGFYLPGLAPVSYCEKQDADGVEGDCKVSSFKYLISKQQVNKVERGCIYKLSFIYTVCDSFSYEIVGFYRKLNH
jgi:hypothetical protein